MGGKPLYDLVDYGGLGAAISELPQSDIMTKGMYPV